MYEKHFSFKCKPFELLPNPDFLFQSSTHKKAITYLDYGIKEKIGFILLTGEIGSGKTTIIRNLIKTLGSSVKLSRINNTKVSSQQLIAMINEDFGMDIEGKSKTRLLSDLNEFLIDQYSNSSQPVLLIDEAQNLSPDLLEEIRLLSNLETDRAKLLQIILVGQTELKKTLMLPEMMQLRQRINISYHISPLTVDETIKYIKHRLTIAGNPDAINFQGEMSALIYRFSRGIPRLTNILCDFALLTAFVEGETKVGIEIVRQVSVDLESRDYWADSNGLPAAAPVKERESSDSKLLGDIAGRVIALEEAVKESIEGMSALSEKIDRFEEKISQTSNGKGDDDKLSGIEERVGRTENISSHESDALGNADIDSDKPVSGQVDVLRKMLKNVNNKLSNM